MRYLLIIALLLLAACGDRNQQIAEEAIRAGNAHYRSSDYVLAVDEYAKANFDPRALHNSAKAHYRAADHAQAVADLAATLEIMDDTIHIADAYHDMGNARLMHSRWADSMSVIAGERSAAIQLEGDDIAEKVRQAVVRDSLSTEGTRLAQLSDSALAQSVIAFKNALRHDPKDEDTRYNLAFSQKLLAAREKERREADEDKEKNKELSERAKALMKKADELVEVFKFNEALELLQRGMAEDPTLAKEKEYVQKLEVVTKAAEAS